MSRGALLGERVLNSDHQHRHHQYGISLGTSGKISTIATVLEGTKGIGGAHLVANNTPANVVVGKWHTKVCRVARKVCHLLAYPKPL